MIVERSFYVVSAVIKLLTTEDQMFFAVSLIPTTGKDVAGGKTLLFVNDTSVKRN